MYKLNYKKLIGAFVISLSLILLLLSISEIFNKVDYLSEYKLCIEVSDYSAEMISACKLSASNGLGFTIRSNQIDLTTTQYLQVYLSGLMMVLISIIFFIIGRYIYFSETKKEVEVKPKIIKKPIVKKTKKKSKK
jgi:uncharacterized membrane protein